MGDDAKARYGPVRPVSRSEWIVDPEAEVVEIQGIDPMDGSPPEVLSMHIGGRPVEWGARQDIDPGTVEEVEVPDDDAGEATFVERAIAAIISHRDWPVKRIAKHLGCSRATIYRHPTVKAALLARRGNCRSLPRGRRKCAAEGGGIEAYRDEEPDEDE